MPPPLKSCPVLPFRTARRPQPFPSRRNSLLSLRAAAPRLVTCSAGCRGRASRTAPSSTSCWASSSRPARQRLRRCAGGGGGGAPALARRAVTRAASRRALVAPWWRAASHEGTLGGMERCGGAMGTGWVREGRRCARAGRAAGRQGRGQEQPRRSRGSGALSWGVRWSVGARGLLMRVSAPARGVLSRGRAPRSEQPQRHFAATGLPRLEARRGAARRGGARGAAAIGAIAFRFSACAVGARRSAGRGGSGEWTGSARAARTLRWPTMEGVREWASARRVVWS